MISARAISEVRRGPRAIALPRLRAIRSVHGPPLGLFALASLWMMKAFVLSAALPAGTDMLGFVTRARENASAAATSLWTPSVFGAPRQFTLDNVLGALTTITHDPVATVKLVAVLTLFASGAFAYFLSHGWFGNRVAASFAGLLYMGSQASVSRWASGQLNLEITIALGPLLILLWSRCLEGFDLGRLVAFAVCLSGLALIRLDMVLYVLPFLGLLAVVHFVLAREQRKAALDLLRAVGFLVPALLALNAMQIVPLIEGIRAPWVSSGQLFSTSNLVEHSLAAYPSVLGFGREIGYLGFTGQQTWFSHPWVPTWFYFAAASVIVVLAYAALLRRRDERTLFLASTAILATFLAKGIRGPFGSPYTWAVRNVPFFGNLRNPNRWLIFQALAYALLAGLTLATIARAVRKGVISVRGRRVRWTALRFALLMLVVALPVGPTIASGFRTWRPAPDQMALLSSVERQEGDFAVATIPFDQSVRFIQQGTYAGFEHDLGAESSAFTGHPTLADGGWDARSANFVAYLSSLLRAGDPAYPELLGTVGVKDLIRFDYPVTAPHLVDPLANPQYQQQAIDSMPGFVPLTTNDAGSVYQLRSWSPLVSFRPNVAAVLGGSAGFASLADMTGVHLQDWAAIGAGDALAAGGMSGLEDLIARAKLVVVSNGSLQDVAVLASPPVVSLAGITSDPGLDRLTQLVPSDASIRDGSLADGSVPAATPGVQAGSVSFSVPAASNQMEVWTRVRYVPEAAKLVYSIDGLPVGSVLPLAPDQAGFRWVRIATPILDAGEHRLSVQTLPSSFGGTYEVDETRLVDSAVRTEMLSRLSAAVSAAGPKVAYAFDLQDAQKWVAPRLARQPAAPGSGQFWDTLEPAFVKPSPVADAGSQGGVAIDVRPGRTFYTVLDHEFARSQDWSNDPFLFLPLNGSASGQTFELVVRFAGGEARFLIPDTWRGWRTVPLATSRPDKGETPFDWASVRSVRLAVDSKDVPILLGAGPLQLASIADPTIRLPVAPSKVERIGVVMDSGIGTGSEPSVKIPVGATTARLHVPFHLIDPLLRFVVPPSAPIREAPAPNVYLQRVGDTEFRYSVDAATGGVLMLNQSFDPRWNLSAGGPDPLPVFSLSNGYLLKAGTHAGTIRYAGALVGIEGLALSGFGLLGLIAIAAIARRRRHAVADAASEEPVRFDTGRRMRRHAVVASAVVLACIAVLGVIPKEAMSSAAPIPIDTGERFWRASDPKTVNVRSAPGPEGHRVTTVAFDGPRAFYTLVGHRFVAPQDWIGRRHLFLAIEGRGDLSSYRLVFDFDTPGGGTASYMFRDVNPGWRELAIDLWNPDAIQGTVDWEHVIGIRLAHDDIGGQGSLQLGELLASKPETA